MSHVGPVLADQRQTSLSISGLDRNVLCWFDGNPEFNGDREKAARTSATAMDKHHVHKMSQKLLGETVGGWKVDKYINHGKSAFIFKGSKDGRVAALKIFDPDIIDRYGRDAQLKRIEREQSLIGKAHPHLVQIYDGGADRDYLFVVMEYFEGKNLAEALTSIPPDNVRSFMCQLAQAAQFLEDASFAHRDIKPENIGVSPDMNTVKLLDLGVIRPFDLTNVTDAGDQQYFVGTLQYSPPDLLFREEEPSVEGWRAITFYQLGAVLHDLLMRTPLFAKFRNPYARMVRAVEQQIPIVNASEADADLRLLAQNCLVKVPNQRLDTVKWEDFYQPKVADPMEGARKRIAQHKLVAAQTREAAGSEDLHNAQMFALRTSIHLAVVSTSKTESLPRYSTKTLSESDPYLLRVLFEPSAKHDFKSWLAIYCEGAVVDPVAQLQELRISACACPTQEAIPSQPDSTAPSQHLKGVLIDQDIRTHVQHCLLLAYADALDLAVEDSKPVNWLTLKGAS